MLFAFCAIAQVPEGSETVVSKYQVKAGKEAEFAKVLAQAWPMYLKEGLVLPKPHLVLRGTDADGNTYFLEVLTWKNGDAPDHAPQEIRTLWKQLEALCEERAGHRGIEFPEVKVVRMD